jgi:filamentous hemagglutinin family protein
MLIRQYRAVLRHSFLMNAILTNPFQHRSLTKVCRSAAGAGVALAMAGTAVGAGPATTSLVVDGTKTSTHIPAPVGGVYEVTTGTVTGNNAINAFTRFDVADGNTVNLRLPSGAINLINLVNDSKASEVYGIVNSLTAAGNIGGNVYFLNPNGMIIGATGVFNVGSLTIQAPTQAVMDSFFSPFYDQDGIINNILEGKIAIGKAGVITVHGKINAMNLVSLQAKDVSLSGAAIYAGEVARAEFAKITNVAGLVPATAFAVTDGAIRIVALSSGNTSATVSIDASTMKADKSISVQASSTSTNAWAGDETATISITGESELVSHGDLSLIATGTISKDVEATTAADLTPEEQAESDQANIDIWGFLGNPLVNVNIQKAVASITVDKDAVLEAEEELTVKSSATFDSKFKVYGLVAGIAWGDGSAKSTINIDGHLEGGAIDVTSITKGTLEVTTSNILHRLITSDAMSFDVMAAVAISNYENTINIGPNAVLKALTPIPDADVADPDHAGSFIKKPVPNLVIKAETEAEEALEVEAGGEKEVAAIAVGVALRTANTSVTIDGTLTGDSIEVGADFEGGDEMGVDSFQGAHFLTPIASGMGLTENTDKIDTVKKFNEAFLEKKGKPGFSLSELGKDMPTAFQSTMKSMQEKVGACGAVAFHESTTSTTVEVNGTITAGNELTIEAKATETGLRRNVSADVGEEKEIGLGIAVVIDDRVNIVDTLIGATAVLTAEEGIKVSAEYVQPYKQTWTDNFTDLWSGDTDLTLKFFTEDLPTLFSCDFGLSSGLFTSGARVAAEGTEFAAAASVNIAMANNQATARVADGAHLATTNASAGAIDISSLVDTEAVNFTGDWGVPLAAAKDAKTGKAKYELDAGFWFHGTESEGSGVGASYLGIFNTNTALALVGNAIITTGKLGVEAKNTGLAVNIGVAGGKAGGFGFDGVVATNFYQNTTIAQISDGAVVTASGLVAVKSEDDFTVIAPQGALCVGSSVGLGVTVGYTQFTRTTAADVGYLDGNSLALAKDVLVSLDPTWSFATGPNAAPVVWNVSGGLSVAAENKGLFVNAALAGAIMVEEEHKAAHAAASQQVLTSGSPLGLVDYDPYEGIPVPKADLGFDNPSDPLPEHAAEASHHAESSSGAGISGGAAVSIFSTTAEALVRGNLQLNAAGAEVALSAKNDDLLVTVAGAATLAGEVTVAGIAGSFVYADTTQNATASLEVLRTTSAKNISAEAERSGLVVSVAASLDAAARDQSFGLAASGAYNNVDGTTQASIKNGTLVATEEVSVNAVDNSTIASATGALTGGGQKVGVGGAFSWNQTDNQTLATIENIRQIDAASVSLLANNNNAIYAPSAAGGVALNESGVGLAGAFSVNLVNDEAHAKIISTTVHSVINTGSLGVQAIDGADGTNGHGNPWVQTKEAEDALDTALKQVDTDTDGVSDGKGDIDVTYTTNPDPYRAAGVTDTTKSYNLSQDTAAAHDKIVAVNLGVGVGSTAGVAVSGAYNQVTGGAGTEVAGNVSINVNGGAAELKAASTGNIIAVGVSVGASEDFAGAMSVGVNLVTTSTKVETNSADGAGNVVIDLQGASSNQLIVASENSTNLLAIDVAVAGSSKVAAITTFGYNQFEGDSLVTLADTTIVSARGSVANLPLNAAFEASNTGNIIAVAAGGSGSGSTAGAASASVNRLGGDSLISLINTDFRIDNASTDTLAATKLVKFDTKATRNILSVCVAGSVASELAGGAGVSYNQIGGQNGVDFTSVDIDVNNADKGALKTAINVTDKMSGQAIVVGGAGSGTGALAASVAINTIGDLAMSPDTSAREKTLTDALTAGNTDAFNDHIVGVQAEGLTSKGSGAVNISGDSDWVTVAVGGAGSGEVAIGLAGAYNNIGGTQSADFRNSDFGSANQFSLSNTSGGNIIGVGAGGSGAGTVAIGTSILINNIYSKTLIDLDKTTIIASDDLPIEAANTSEAVTVSVGGAVAGSVAIGVTGMANKFTNEVAVDVHNASVLATNKAAKSILLSASQTNDITSVAVGGGGAGTVAVAGAVGVNLSNSTTRVAVDNSTLTSQGNLALRSNIDEDILSIGVGASGAGVASVAGTVNPNVLGLHNTISVTDGSTLVAQGSPASYKSSDGLNGILIEAITNEKLKVITINAGGAGVAAVQAAVGVNQISSDTEVTIDHSSLTTNSLGGDILVSAKDSTTGSIYAVSVGVAADLGVGAGVGINTFSQTVKTSVVNATLNAARDIIINAMRQQSGTAVMVGVGGGIAGVGGSVGYAEYSGLSSANVQGGRLTAGRDINLESKADIIVDGDIGSGAGGVVGLAAGVQVISVTGHTEAVLTQHANLNAEQDINVDAASAVKLDTVVISAGAGYVGVDGAINILGFSDTAYIHGDSEVSLDATRNLALEASDKLTVDSIVGGLAGGVVGIGASLDLITAQSSALVEFLGTANAGQSASFSSQLTRDVDSTLVSGTVGGVAAGGAVIVAKFGPNQSVTGAAKVTGYDKSGALLTQPVADMNMVISDLKDNQLGGLYKDKVLTQSEAKTVTSQLNGSWATLQSKPSSSSVSVNGRVTAGTAISVSADDNTTFKLLPVMASAGGVSIGASVAYAKNTDITSVSVGGTCTAPSISIEANDSAKEAFVLGAGAGGIVSVAAAYGQIVDNAEIDATVLQGSVMKASAGLFSLKANSVQAVSDQGDLAMLSGIGGSGAGVYVDSKRIAQVNIENQAKIDADIIDVDAGTSFKQNDASSDDFPNVLLPGISLGGVTVSINKTTLSNRSAIMLGNSVNLAAGSALALNTLNEIETYDFLDVVAGGLLTVVEAQNTLVLNLGGDIAVGQLSTLSSNGSLDLGANTTGSASLKTTGNCGTIAGNADAHATIQGSIHNSVAVDGGAILSSVGNMSVLSGCDIDQLDDALSLSTTSRSYAYGVIAIPTTTAKTTISQTNKITVGDGSQLQAQGDISLLAGKHGPTLTAYYSAKWNGIGSDYQGATLDDSGGQSGVTLDSTLTVDGAVASGLHDQVCMSIDASENVSFLDPDQPGAGSLAWMAPTYTLKKNVSMALAMDARITQLNADIARFSANGENVDKYRADLASAIALQASYGTKTADLFTINPITLRLHNVSLGAATLLGSGSVSASAGNKVKIVNASAANLIIGRSAADGAGVVVDDTKGYVYFNSVPVTKLAGFTGSLASIQAGNVPSVVLKNTNHDNRPLLQISGDIINNHGTISLISTGTAYIDGASLRAKTVTVSAGGDYIQSYTAGFTNIGGEPAAGYTIEGTPVSPAPVVGSRIVAGSIYISAEKLNINGLLRSGLDSLTVTITDDDVTAAGGKTGTADVKIRDLNDANGGYVAELLYNPNLKSFSISDVTLGGGYIELFGNIFSTGNGAIQVFDGSGTISINNPTAVDLRLSELDNGYNKGIVRITDTSKPYGNQYVTTEFTRENGAVSQVSYVMDGANRLTNPLNSTTANPAEYQPTKNRELRWINEKVTDEVVLHQQGKLIKKPYTETDLPDETTVVGTPVTAKGGYWLEEGSADSATTKEVKRVMTADNVDYSSRKVDGKNQQRWKTYYTVTRDTTVIKPASVPIKVSFFGSAAGAISVNSTNSALTIGDNVNAHGGTVDLAATWIHQTGSGTISGSTISLTSSSGSIGQSGTPLMVDASKAINASSAGNISLTSPVGDLRIDRLHAMGRVSLDSAGSIIGVAGHEVGYDTKLPASSGSSQQIKMHVDQTPHIVAKEITLKANDSIGGEAGTALVVANLDNASELSLRLTAQAGTGDINLSAPTVLSVNGSAPVLVPLNLSVNTITAENGNVTLTAPGANILDGNNVLTLDPLTDEELKTMWGDNGLTGVNGTNKVAIDEQQRIQQALQNGLTLEYHQTWASVDYKRANYNPTYAFSFTAAEHTALSGQGVSDASISAEEARRTQFYHATLKPETAVYNSTYKYVLSDAQKADIATAKWNANNMLDSAPVSAASTLGLSPGHGVGVEEVANIVGKVLTISGLTVGSTTGTISFPASTAWQNMTPEQQFAVRMASTSDVSHKMVNGVDQVSIHTGDDLDILASKSLSLTSIGLARVYSDEDLLCSHVDLRGGAIITSYKNLDIAGGSIDGDISLYAWDTLSFYAGVEIPLGNGNVHVEAANGINIYTTPENGRDGLLGAGLGPKAGQISAKFLEGWSLKKIRYMLQNFAALAGLDYHMQAHPTSNALIPASLEKEEPEPVIVVRHLSF